MSHTENAKLLVTGATGFLGQAVMARAGAWNLKAIPAPRHVFGPDNAAAFTAFLDKVQPAFAIDAAGVVPGRGDVATNLALTRRWIEALTHARSAPRLVFVNSAAIYGAGAARNRATREGDPRQPLADYGRAKLAALEMGRAAHDNAGLDIQTAVVFNLMGTGQQAHLAPRVFIEKAIGADCGRYQVGPVGAVRDFMDVEDAADALIAMALHGRAGEVVNVATGRPTRISDLLDAIDARTGASWESRASGDGGSDVCYGDPARLTARTGWRPRFDFETALTRAIDAEYSKLGTSAKT
ncbi:MULTISPECIES: NAD-dependent epimerase/dehydratase family protein [unclassified Roseovarius]|uniref:NAD-dependent epimerase/dehydratase family protein n=1 Tax=unclassified Roseovarius TaxID=2614913 RepID=UPI00273D343F|nr:NAD(P)-dependent oxidoreductase [Roseovarius sp. MMSF_3350]